MMGDETIISKVRKERRAENLETENKHLRALIWIVIAAVGTIFLAGGNWYVSQHRLNSLEDAVDKIDAKVEKIEDRINYK